jgi:hypothetical protein
MSDQINIKGNLHTVLTHPPMLRFIIMKYQVYTTLKYIKKILFFKKMMS